jgi:hypothetical protein
MTRLLRRCVPLMLLLAAPGALAQGGPPPAQAPPQQEPEVLIPRGARHGGWGAPVVHVSTLRGEAAVFVGGRGGWLLDGRVTIGGGGFGLVNDVPAPPEVEGPGEDLDLEMGYGGLWLEYTFAPAELVHVSVGTLVGGGGLSLVWHGGGSYGSQSEGFFVAEPTVVVELNVADFVRADLGAAYRWVAGVDMPGLSYSDVAGFSVVAALKFGSF